VHICGASSNGLIQTHFIPLGADFGLPAVGAASVLAAMGMFDIAGIIGSGWLSDRYDSRWLLFWYYGLRGSPLMYLPFSLWSITVRSVLWPRLDRDGAADCEAHGHALRP
jgi:hypothetical protein